MVTNLEVDLADMYAGRNVEVRNYRPYQGKSSDQSSFKYPARSFAPIVTDREPTRMRT